MPARVSLCVIARNEEARLPRCLGSAADLVQDIVVVDTGSTDRTREVAARFGARVSDFPWCDDFAAARNEALRHANGQWIFWLDADDQLDDVNRQRLRTLFAGLQDENAAYLLTCLSLGAAAGELPTRLDQVRLFRNHPQIRWKYRVHEQIVPAIQAQGGVVKRTDVAIQHTGYQNVGEQRRKLERNLRLSQLEDAERPNDPLTLFHLGWTFYLLGRPAEAIPPLSRSLERVQPQETIVRKLFALLVRCQRQLGRPADALAVCRQGRSALPSDPELLFHEGQLLREGGDLVNAEARLRQLLNTPPEPYVAIAVDPGLHGYKARCALAEVYRDQGRAAEAEAQWRAALQEQPDLTVALICLGDLWLAQGRWQDVEQLARKLESDARTSIQAALLRARAHLARKEFAAARSLLEATSARAPGEVWPRELLAHVLLQEGRDWAALERALRDVLTVDPTNNFAQQQLPLALQRQKDSAMTSWSVDTTAPPPDPNARFQQAEEAFRQRRFDEAAVTYRQLLAANVSPAVMLWRLGAVANAQGDCERAWELHHKALVADPRLAATITPNDYPHHGVVCQPRYDTEDVPLCPVCGGAEQKPLMVVSCLDARVYHPSFSPIRRWVQCQRCGHGFANPRPSAAALARAFDDPAPSHLVSWQYDKLTTWSDIVHDIWQRRPSGRWLDVGVANGSLAGVAQDYGYEVVGVDRHPGYAAQVRQLGVEFLLGDIATLDLGERRFDVVSLGDVIEHVPDPKSVIKRVAALLEPAGLLWLSTPNYEGVWTRARRDEDAMWKEGEHLHFFGLRSLRRLLADAGLEVMDYRLSKRFLGCAEVLVRFVPGSGQFNPS